MGKLVKQGLVIPTNSTKEHENLRTCKILYVTYETHSILSLKTLPLLSAAIQTNNSGEKNQEIAWSYSPTPDDIAGCEV
jgi:hypothetical protein